MKNIKAVKAINHGKWMTTLLVGLMFSHPGYAAVEDFNSIIEENIQAQNQLRQELKKQVKAVDSQDLKELKKKNFAETGKAVLGSQNTENVAVNSKNDPTKARGSKAKNALDLEKRNLKRLSEEIKQAQ